MKLTLLAAAVMVATAPSASAICVGSLGCGFGGQVGGTVGGAIRDVGGIGTGAVEDAAGIAFSTVNTVEGTVQEQAADGDGDNVPDEAEGLLCSNPFSFEVVNLDTVPGTCKSASDYEPPNDVVNALEDAAFLVNGALATVGETSAEAERQAGLLLAEADETLILLDLRVRDAAIAAEAEADEAAATVQQEAAETRALAEQEAAEAQALATQEAEETRVLAEQQAWATVAIVDSDGDKVSDALEPLICAYVERGSLEPEGRCEGDDYFPWVSA